MYSVARIATDKRGYPHNIFLFLEEYICCEYSLEASRQGSSNEYPQHMYSSRNKNIISIFRTKKAPYLLLWCGGIYSVYNGLVLQVSKELFHVI